MSTPNALATDKGCRAAVKAKGSRLQREDFPATPEGWTLYCDYRIRMYTRHAARAARNLDYWKRVRSGEHLAAAMVKIDALQQAQDELAKLRAELDQLKSKK